MTDTPTPRSLSEALSDPRGLWTMASNAIPVIGVVVFGWKALPLLVFYWLENVLIGALNVPKIALSGVTKAMPQPVIGIFFAAFFVLHYGLFCFVHGVFVFVIFAIGDMVNTGTEPTGETFDLLTRVQGVLDPDLLWSVALMALVRLGEFAYWIVAGHWRAVEPQMQMMEPYGRIIVLHMTIFICTIPIIALGQPMLAVLVLALLKTGLELGLPMFGADPKAAPDTR